MFAPVSFLVASLLACLTAFTYAEMSARYPFSAGEAVYLHMGFSMQWLSMLVGLLIILAGIVSAATIARGFTGYLEVFVNLPAPLAIVTLVLVLGVDPSSAHQNRYFTRELYSRALRAMALGHQ